MAGRRRRARVAVGERRERDRALPPGDAAHAEGADAADQADCGIGQRRADRRAEVGADDLGVLMHEHERLQVVERRGAVEQRVVALEDRPDRRLVVDDRSRLGGEPDAGRRAGAVDVRAGDGAAERDHRAPPPRHRRAQLLAQRRDLVLELPLAAGRHVRGAGGRRRAGLRGWARRRRRDLDRRVALAPPAHTRPVDLLQRLGDPVRGAELVDRAAALRSHDAVVVDDQVAADGQLRVQRLERGPRRLVVVGVEPHDRPARGRRARRASPRRSRGRSRRPGRARTGRSSRAPRRP